MELNIRPTPLRCILLHVLVVSFYADRSETLDLDSVDELDRNVHRKNKKGEQLKVDADARENPEKCFYMSSSGGEADGEKLKCHHWRVDNHPHDFSPKSCGVPCPCLTEEQCKEELAKKNDAQETQAEQAPAGEVLPADHARCHFVSKGKDSCGHYLLDHHPDGYDDEEACNGICPCLNKTQCETLVKLRLGNDGQPSEISQASLQDARLDNTGNPSKNISQAPLQARDERASGATSYSGKSTGIVASQEITDLKINELEAKVSSLQNQIVDMGAVIKASFATAERATDKLIAAVQAPAAANSPAPTARQAALVTDRKE